MGPESAFGIPGTGDHLAPESVFTILRNGCSRSIGIGVQDAAEYAISALKRRHGLRRCRYRGLLGMERWVGLGVIANDLLVLGRAGARTG